jgi:hypothetical protein
MLKLSARDGRGAVASIEIPVVTSEPSPAPTGDDADPAIIELDGLPVQRVVRHPLLLRAVIIVLGWSIVAAIWTEVESVVPLATKQTVQWVQMISTNMTIAGVWMVLTPMVILLAARLLHARRRVRLAVHAPGAVTFSLIHVFITGALMKILLGASGAEVRSVRLSWVVWNVVAYTAIVALVEIISGRARLRREMIDAREAQSRFLSARLSLLRLQLQPDILMDGLDAVARSVASPARCETVITRLGDVLRLLLSAAGRDEVTLSQELDLLSAYLEAVTGGGASISVTGVSGHAALPAVVLQPIAASINATSAHISSTRIMGHLAIDIVSTGAGNSEVHHDKLQAIEKRLTTLYGADYDLRLTNRAGSPGVHMELPYHELNEPDAVRPPVRHLAIA